MIESKQDLKDFPGSILALMKSTRNLTACRFNRIVQVNVFIDPQVPNYFSIDGCLVLRSADLLTYPAATGETCTRIDIRSARTNKGHSDQPIIFRVPGCR